MADNGCLLAAFAFAQNQVKLRVRFSLNNLKLDDDVLNIPLFQADQADRLIRQALRILGQAGIESKVHVMPAWARISGWHEFEVKKRDAVIFSASL